MRLIAIRTYELDDQVCTDRLFQKGPNADTFALHTSALDDEPERWEVLSAEQAGQWLSEAPEQLILSKAIAWA